MLPRMCLKSQSTHDTHPHTHTLAKATQTTRGSEGLRCLPVAPGLTTRSKDATRGSWTRSILTTSNKKLLGAPGLTTRRKEATRSENMIL